MITDPRNRPRTANPPPDYLTPDDRAWLDRMRRAGTEWPLH